MISVRLMGGLGNQMFQYAIARKLAITHHTSAYLDLVFYETDLDGVTPRRYELSCFNIAADILPATRRPIDADNAYIGKRGKLLKIKHRLQRKALNIYREPHHNFDSKVAKIPNDSYLIGYWQTEKYFSDIRQTLLQDFSVTSEAKGNNKKLLDEIRSNEDSISIHVRRGDYVSNASASKFHGLKNQTYYHKALSVILKKCKNPILYVFSDDPTWCKNYLKFEQKTVYVEGNKDGFEDMRLMINCKHNIIANSSFSWWAAWLNNNPDKIVVAPAVWFNDPSIDTSDVVPVSWIKV